VDALTDFQSLAEFDAKSTCPSLDTRTMSLSIPSVMTWDERSAFDEENFDEIDIHNDEQLIINAPPGKLGIMMETLDNGELRVHSISKDSVLRDQLQLGDVLLQLDGEEMNHMTALEASALIGERSTNDVRNLTFVRCRNRRR